MVIVTKDGREFNFSDDISEEQAHAIVRATLAAEADGKSSQDKKRELAATSEALLRAEAAVAEANGRVAELSARVDAMASMKADADKAQDQITALHAKIELLANARPTIVAKASPVADNSAAVVAALVQVQATMQAGFDRMFRAQMADTVLRVDEFGEQNRSIKVIGNG